MIVYRIAHLPYIDLSGNGGLYYSGRWHHKGHRIIYASANLETCLLEIAANNYLDTARKLGKVMKIIIPDSQVVTIQDSGLLPPSYNLDKTWRSMPHEKLTTQQIGTSFLLEQNHLAMCVPSIVVNSETAVNYLINPDHPLMSEVTFESYPLNFDMRL